MRIDAVKPSLSPVHIIPKPPVSRPDVPAPAAPAAVPQNTGLPDRDFTVNILIPEITAPEILIWRDFPQNGENELFGPAYTLEISPEAFAAYYADNSTGDKTPVALTGDIRPQAVSDSADISTVKGPETCSACESRKYADRSGDGSVSYQAPTHIGRNAAAAAVAAHEGEHVNHERAKAEKDGRRIVSQSVSIHTAICPECGRTYISGGETKTVTASGKGSDKQENIENPQEQSIL
ncbi:MAG: hypothetical protein FWG32_02980 [Oscillospiraceae bacterium]|nr:hypothetical protein [Oscillospiraceae bacterium]